MKNKVGYLLTFLIIFAAFDFSWAIFISLPFRIAKSNLQNAQKTLQLTKRDLVELVALQLSLNRALNPHPKMSAIQQNAKKDTEMIKARLASLAAIAGGYQPRKYFNPGIINQDFLQYAETFHLQTKKLLGSVMDFLNTNQESLEYQNFAADKLAFLVSYKPELVENATLKELYVLNEILGGYQSQFTAYPMTGPGLAAIHNRILNSIQIIHDQLLILVQATEKKQAAANLSPLKRQFFDTAKAQQTELSKNATELTNQILNQVAISDLIKNIDRLTKELIASKYFSRLK